MVSDVSEKRRLNKSHYIVTALISIIIYVIIVYLCEMAPFGDNTWVSYDMKRQYVDFYSFYRHILSGDNNIFYSFSTTLGSGIIGFCAYYLASPFLFLIILFPNELMPLAITIVIGLKLACASSTMDIFLQKYCGKGSYLCAVTYSFCGFVIANSMNIMWLDVIILMPIVMLMTERLLSGGKLMGYVTSVAVILYLNYYISYMVLIFVLIWFLIRMIARREKNPSQAIFRLGMATVAGAGIDAVVLIPTFLELKNSPKDITNESLAIAHNAISVRQVLCKLFSLSYDSLEIYWGAPMVFCGMLMVVLVILFFLNKKIKLSERISMLLILAIFAVSFVNEQLNLIWHSGMEPSGYPYRQAFMCVFVMIVCACRCLQEFKQGITIPRLAIALAVVLAAMYYAFSRPAPYMEQWKIWINYAGFAAVFVLLALLILSKKRIATMAICFLLVCLQFADLGVNAIYIHKMESMQQETASEFAKKISAIDKTVNAVKALDDSFYRMENWSPRQQNDSMMFMYNGVTHYSSAGLIYVREMLKNMGYNDDGLFADYGYNNTQTADSILGVKYLLTDAAHAGRMHKDYELVVDGDIQAYRNPYALPVGMGVYREMSGESMDPFSFQEDIYTRLVGELVEIFEPAEIEEREIISGRPEIEYKVTATITGDMYFYVADIIDDFDNMEIYLNDEFISYYGNNSCLKIIDLGYLEKGDTIYVRIKADEADEIGTPLFMTENTEALAEAYDAVASRFAVVDKISSSHLKMTVDSAYTIGDEISGQIGIFTTIPYEKGWKIKVAGTKVQPKEAYDSLIYIPVTEAIQMVELEPGQNIEIEMTYIPEGLILGLCMTALSILIIILVARLRITEADYFEYEDEDDEESNLVREDNK